MELVVTHRNTDFDGLASMIAATLIYPGSVPMLSRSLNPNVKAFLSIHKDLFHFRRPGDLNPETVKRLIVVDTGCWDRLDGVRSLKKAQDLQILVWDHHEEPGDIEPTWSCRRKVGATVSLMVPELRSREIVLSAIQATVLLAGIYEDTGSLTFSGTTAEDAYAAGFLLERGADLDVIASLLRPAYGERQKNILFAMLQKARRTNVNGHKVSINVQAISGHVDSLAIVVRMYMDIVNVDGAFGIFCDDERGRTIVIGRSRSDGLNIGDIMRRLGGGGHNRAGSALVKSSDAEAVARSLKEILHQSRQSAIQVNDLMSFPVVTIAASLPMRKAAAILRQKGCTGVPVEEDGKLVGMISRRDFRKIHNENHLERPVKAYMSTPVQTIGPGASPMYAARLMIKHDIGRLPVVDGDRIIGIVTRSDTMVYFYDQLPD